MFILSSLLLFNRILRQIGIIGYVPNIGLQFEPLRLHIEKHDHTQWANCFALFLYFREQETAYEKEDRYLCSIHCDVFARH